MADVHFRVEGNQLTPVEGADLLAKIAADQLAGVTAARVAAEAAASDAAADRLASEAAAASAAGVVAGVQTQVDDVDQRTAGIVTDADGVTLAEGYRLRRFSDADYGDGVAIQTGPHSYAVARATRLRDGAQRIGSAFLVTGVDDVHAYFIADESGAKALGVRFDGTVDFLPGPLARGAIGTALGLGDPTLVTTWDGSAAQLVERVRAGPPALYRYSSGQDGEARHCFVQRAGETFSMQDIASPIALWVTTGESIDNAHSDEPLAPAGTAVVIDALRTPQVPGRLVMMDSAAAPYHPEPWRDQVANPATATAKAKLFGGWDPDKVTRLIAWRDYYTGAGNPPRGQSPEQVAAAWVDQDDLDRGRPQRVTGFVGGGQGGLRLKHVVKRDLSPSIQRAQYAPAPNDPVQFQPFYLWDRLMDPVDGLVARFRQLGAAYKSARLSRAVVVEGFEHGIAYNDRNPYRSSDPLSVDDFLAWTVQLIGDIDAAVLAFQPGAPVHLITCRGGQGTTDFPNFGTGTLAYTKLALQLMKGTAPAAIDPERVFVVGPDYSIEKGSAAHPSARGQVATGESLRGMPRSKLRDGRKPDVMLIDETAVTKSLVGGKTTIRLPVIGRFTGPLVIDTDTLPATEAATGTTTTTPVFGATDGSTYQVVRGGYPYIAAAQDAWLDTASKAARPDWTKHVKGFWAYQTATWPAPGGAFVPPTPFTILSVAIDGAAIVVTLDTNVLTGITLEYALNGPGNSGATSDAAGATKMSNAWGNVRDSLSVPSRYLSGVVHHNWLLPMRIAL